MPWGCVTLSGWTEQCRTPVQTCEIVQGCHALACCSGWTTTFLRSQYGVLHLAQRSGFCFDSHLWPHTSQVSLNTSIFALLVAIASTLNLWCTPCQGKSTVNYLGESL